MVIPLNLGPRLGTDCLMARRVIDPTGRADAAWRALHSLEAMYPGFRRWYWGKVVPGLATGERHIFLDGHVSSPRGLAIAKRDSTEAKVCTLWVAPSERGRGLGQELLEKAVEWVGVDHPLFTVPQERYDELLPLTQKLGFCETAPLESLYRPGIVEHIFNGTQTRTLSS